MSDLYPCLLFGCALAGLLATVASVVSFVWRDLLGGGR